MHFTKKIRQNHTFTDDKADSQTVKKYHDTLTLAIYDRNTQLTTISISSHSTVEQLTKNVRRKLKNVHNIVCLASKNGRQIIDYILLIPQHSISFLKNFDHLMIITEGQIQDYSQPTITDFNFLKCLGQGGSASVFLVRHKLNGRLYALKQIQKTYFVEFKRMEQVLREKKIMSEMLPDFPFVSQLYASFESERHLNFLLEFYPGGQLFFHLQQRRFNQEEAKLYFAEMILTFQFLHRQKIVYRDLKPQNILIDLNGHSKLTDFGLCKLNLQKQDLTSSYCGSLQYMAPQVKQNIGYNYSVDFYALGAFLFEMVVGVPPYYNNQPLFFPQHCTKAFSVLVTGLIQQNPKIRLNSFKIIKQSIWLKGIDWNKILRKQYTMPLKINPYSSYIHNQFKQISTYEQNKYIEQRYDKLFNFFFYMKSHTEGLSSSYVSTSAKSFHKKISIQNNKSSSSTSLKKKSLSKLNSKSYSKNKEIHRENLISPSIYTFKKKNKSKLSVSKQKQKSRESMRNHSPIKGGISFKKAAGMTNIKSAQSILKTFSGVRYY